MSFLAALTVGSGLISAYGQYQQGQQAAKASEMNAQTYERQAELTRQLAARDVETGERQKESFLSTQRSQYAFRGVKISGSPLLVMADTAANLEQDIRMTEYRTLIGAAQASSAASQERMRARIYRMQSYAAPAVTLINTAYKASNFTGTKPVTPVGKKTGIDWTDL